MEYVATYGNKKEIIYANSKRELVELITTLEIEETVTKSWLIVYTVKYCKPRKLYINETYTTYDDCRKEAITKLIDIIPEFTEWNFISTKHKAIFNNQNDTAIYANNYETLIHNLLTITITGNIIIGHKVLINLKYCKPKARFYTERFEDVEHIKKYELPKLIKSTLANSPWAIYRKYDKGFNQIV